jgi:hypothetical protein
MMSLYIRIFTNFYSHRKTLRLLALIGNDALWVPPRLWAYAAENQPDGIFEGYTADEIASLIGYKGDAERMLQALISARFLDREPLRIHDWEEHNAYHKTYSNRAKKAATARWSSNRIDQGTQSASHPSSDNTGNETEKERKGDKHCIVDASSTVIDDTSAAVAAPASPIQSIEDWISELQASTAYAHLAVKLEYSKMLHWCKENGKKPTRRRLINWLNRCDAPAARGSGCKPIQRQFKTTEIDPENI